MPVINPMRTGTLGQCEDGTLIAFERAGKPLVLAVLLSKIDGQATLGVLRGEDGEPPYLTARHIENTCVVLGTNWLFEVLPDFDCAADMNIGHSSGGVIVSGSDTILRFGRDPNDHSRSLRPAYVNMQTFAGHNPVGDYTTVREWCLWLDAEHRSRQGAKPTMSFKASLPQPR